jgi:Nucleotidyl transferase AbiEii toxin, Type IV TA system
VTFAELIADVVARLDAAGIPYMLTGSIASSWYGEPRATRDLDVVIDPTSSALERLVASLQADGWYVDQDVAKAAHRDRTQFNAIGPDAFKVDFIVRHDRPFSVAEFERRLQAELLGTRTFVPTVEDMVIAKLDWAKATDSDRQLRDVDGMLDVVGDEIDRDYIDSWAQRLGLQAMLSRLRQG